VRGRTRSIALVGVVGLAIALVLPVPRSRAVSGRWRQKVAAHVLLDTARGRSASFVVMLASQADLSAAASLPTKLAKGRFVFDSDATGLDLEV